MRTVLSLFVCLSMIGLAAAGEKGPGKTAPRGAKPKHEAKGGQVSFNGAPLEDVVSFLAQVADVNIVIDKSVDRKTPITLTVFNMTGENLLRWVTRLAGATYVYKDEAIWIVSKEKLESSRPKVPIVIDVRDLTGRKTDFPGPRFTLSGTGLVDVEEAQTSIVNESQVTTKEDIHRVLRSVIGDKADDVILKASE